MNPVVGRSLSPAGTRRESTAPTDVVKMG